MEPLVWIDCDTGLDDALALLYAAASGAELLGVSTVAGNCPLSDATHNTLAVLALAGQDAVPVYPGAALPLRGPQRGAEAIHGSDGLGGLRGILPPPAASARSTPAAVALAQACRTHPGRLQVVATGPLTNLALAAALDPDVPRLVQRLVIMGGAATVPGNITAVAEFNVWSDPEAAALVCRNPWPALWVPLDVTHRVRAGPGEIARLEAAGRRRPPAAFAAQALQQYTQAYRLREGCAEAPLHDPLAVAVCLHPDLVRTLPCTPDVECAGTLTRGMLVVDRRPGEWHTAPAGGPQHTLALEVDRPRALQILLDAWCSHGPPSG